MESEGIQFASVLEAIDHYQRVKSQQEETLRELRQKGSKLADALDVSFIERVQAESRKSKATEAHKMVQHRVTQLQTQLTALRETSERGRKAVERFHREINTEKAQQLEESAKFEVQLETVCNELKSMWKFYSKENIKTLIVDNECAIAELQRKISEMTLKLDELRGVLEQLKIDNETEARRRQELEIPGSVQFQLINDQMAIKRAAVDELRLASQRVEDLKAKLAQLKSAQ